MCTAVRFTGKTGTMYFGRNLDWTQGYGERVVVTPPAAAVPPAFERPDDPARGRAVIGMGIVADGIPLYFDCGNDAGLAVAGLNFPQSARYADAPAADRTNVAAYEFPYWACRNFSTLAEVRAALAHVTVVAQPVNEQLPVANLHWIVGDRTGSVVVECLEGGLTVWENDVDVLTNEPDFGWHRQNLRNYLTLDDGLPATAAWDRAELAPFGSGVGVCGLPGDYGGPARFVRAAFVNAHYPAQNGEKDNVTRLFRTLGAAAVPDGVARMGDGAYEKTLYTSCFSAGTQTYYHATYDDPAIRAYPLASCDLTGTEPLVAQPAA
ncbi:choloylglycine hydrolase [Thermophilibacter sp.]